MFSRVSEKQVSFQIKNKFLNVLEKVDVQPLMGGKQCEKIIEIFSFYILRKDGGSFFLQNSNTIRIFNESIASFSNLAD